MLKVDVFGVLVAYNGEAFDMEWIKKLINSESDCIMLKELSILWICIK